MVSRALARPSGSSLALFTTATRDLDASESWLTLASRRWVLASPSCPSVALARTPAKPAEAAGSRFLWAWVVRSTMFAIGILTGAMSMNRLPPPMGAPEMCDPVLARSARPSSVLVAEARVPTSLLDAAESLLRFCIRVPKSARPWGVAVACFQDPRRALEAAGSCWRLSMSLAA